DLRRDRPSRAQRRATTNASERAHLQPLFVPRLAPLRSVEPVIRPTFGPRVGHGILSSETTPATPALSCRSPCTARLERRRPGGLARRSSLRFRRQASRVTGAGADRRLLVKANAITALTSKSMTTLCAYLRVAETSP